MNSVHSGHRKRLKERCLKYGFDSLHDHEKLELLLFNVIPRHDTNPIAHSLLNKFGGNLAKVLEADIDELKTIDGIGDNAAFFIRLLPSVAGSYALSKWEKGISLGTTEQLIALAKDIFIGRTEEELAVICLDSNRNLKNYEIIQKGTVNEVHFSTRKIAEYAMKSKAVNIVLAHNHPNGSYVPSRSDVEVTIQLEETLRNLSLNVLDHIIVSSNQGYSMKDMGNF